jgi:hypothetical protein
MTNVLLLVLTYLAVFLPALAILCSLMTGLADAAPGKTTTGLGS